MIENYVIFQALHHPFTAPNPEDLNDLSSARALAYDMVYNGVEVRTQTLLVELHISWNKHFQDVGWACYRTDWWWQFENLQAGDPRKGFGNCRHYARTGKRSTIWHHFLNILDKRASRYFQITLCCLP